MIETLTEKPCRTVGVPGLPAGQAGFHAAPARRQDSNPEMKMSAKRCPSAGSGCAAPRQIHLEPRRNRGVVGSVSASIIVEGNS